MKAVVSGASGYLGSRLIPELVNRGYDHVCGLVFEPEILADLLEEYSDRPQIAFAASDDWSATKDVLRDADVLIHCAFPRAQAAEYLAAGLKYGNDLFVAARKSQCKAVINISSQSVYDSSRNYAAAEDSPLVLDSTYATAKYASELMLDDVYAGLPHTNIRLASLIGPGFDQRVPNKMIKRVIAGDPITVQGGEQVFDYMDVRDAVDALVTVATANQNNWQPILNVGSMQPYTLNSLAQLVVNLARRNDRYSAPEVRHTSLMSRDQQSSNSMLDCRLFMHTFNWLPSYSLEDSITAILRYTYECEEQ